MVEMLFTHTNKRIESFLSELAEEVLQSGKYPHLKCTDAIELKAFMGLFYYRGLYNLTFHSLDILFSKFDGPPVFSATMSSNRFKFLLWNLCFDDVATRNDSWSHNRFPAMPMLFEKWEYRLPSSSITWQNLLNMDYFSNE